MISFELISWPSTTIDPNLHEILADLLYGVNKLRDAVSTRDILMSKFPLGLELSGLKERIGALE
jgi:hypothetical protein